MRFSTPEKQTKFILIVTPLVILLISFAIGYIINMWFGIGMFIAGIILVEIPQLKLYKELTKSDDTPQKGLRT